MRVVEVHGQRKKHNTKAQKLLGSHIQDFFSANGGCFIMNKKESASSYQNFGVVAKWGLVMVLVSKPNNNL